VNSTIRFELIQSTQALQKLAPHWDQLLDQSTVRTPFMRWDWVSLWWQQFHHDHQLAIGTVWDHDHQLLGLAPLVIGPGPSPARKNLRHLSFISGIGEVVSEGFDLICRPGAEALLTPLLDYVLHTLRDCWDTALFGFMEPLSPFYPILQQALDRHTHQVEETNTQFSPIIRFPHRDWATYLNQRSPSFRKKYKGLVRNSSASYQVTYHQSTSTAEATQNLDTLLQLHAQRWTTEQSLFLQPRTRAFHQQLASRWCPANRAALLVLTFDNRPVAANYAFVEGQTLWDYQGGWCLDDIDHSPAKLIMAENLRWAMAQGLTECDMLPGDLTYKAKWTAEQRTVVDLVADNPASLRIKIFQSIRAIKKTFTSIVHSLT
jgi:CelD/BcsL family acetyltransferase involved in cellulose biosynthesis